MFHSRGTVQSSVTAQVQRYRVTGRRDAAQLLDFTASGADYTLNFDTAALNLPPAAVADAVAVLVGAASGAA